MLGARIAALRKDAGLSQAELASHLGVSASAVGMYEQGRREPSADTLVAIARVFRVSTDYLLTGRPADKLDDQTLARLLLRTVGEAEARLQRRPDQPFTRQELAALVAALLMES